MTVYPVIGEPPSDEGEVHDTTLCAFAPLVPETLVGAPGTAAVMKIVALPIPLSPYAPTIAVFSSLDNATEMPNKSPAAPLVWVIVCCCVHVPLVRVNTDALPCSELSPDAPTIAVFPSLDNATDEPKASFAAPPVWVIVCCGVHVVPERVKIDALP